MQTKPTSSTGFIRILTALAVISLFSALTALVSSDAQAQASRATETSTAPAPRMGMGAVGARSPSQTGARVGEVVPGEDWKGPRSELDWHFSFSSGLGLLASDVGVPLIGGVAKKILHEGFVPDINNQVFIEGQTGPLLIKGSSAWLWSAHLRWDFEQDERFRYFAVAGLGGNFVSKKLGDRSEFFPRVGLGLLYSLTRELKLRADVSHEWTTVGVTLGL